MIQELKDQTATYIDASLVAAVYVGMGDNKQALDWLEKAYDERSLYMAWLKVEPKWDSLRTDPRFTALLQHVGLV